MAAVAGEISFQSQLVGRAAELSKLEGHLEAVALGKGRVLFLAGEAGIGKSRLLEELRARAAAHGFRTMGGTCFHEALTPYSAFLEAFQAGGLEYLFTEEPLRVESLFVIDSAGLVLAKAERAESPLDPDIFTSMIRVVEEFLKDAVRQAGGETKKGGLNVLGLADYRIVLEPGPHATIVAILTGRENEFLLEDLRGVVARIEEKFGEVLAKWAGTLEDLAGMDDFLKPVLASKKYDGVDYARGDAQIKRNRLFENVSLGLVRESRAQPLLVTLDDLQWADASSIALIHYIARGVRNARVLLVGAYRIEELAMGLRAGQKHPLEETMQIMSREGLHEEIRVPRLDEAQTTQLVESLLGRVDLVEEHEREVFRHSGGNPFFLIELARLVIQEGLLVRENDIWRFSKMFREVQIPTRVYHVVQRRLQRVVGEARDVLDLAAILGDEFAPDVLAASLGKDRITLLRQLRELETTHQLLRSAQARYRFDHPQIREVLLREMPEGIRMEYHRIAAESLEKIHGANLPKNYRALGEVAYHCYEARDAEKGVPYNLLAGAAARAAYANAEAIQFWTQALELMGPDTPTPQRAETLETRGDIRDLAGQYDEAIEDYRQVLDLLSEHREASARTHRKIGAIYQRRGRYPEAEAEVRKGLELLGTSRVAEAGLHALWLGRIAWARGDYEAAMQEYGRASEILEKAPDRDELDLAEAQYSAGMVHYGLATREPGRLHEHIEDARAAFLACAETRRRKGDEAGLRPALNMLATMYAIETNYEQAIQHYQESVKIGERVGDLWGITKPLMNLGRVYVLQGNGDQAIITYRRALGILIKVGDQHGLAAVYRGAADVYVSRGDWAAAAESYGRCLEIAEHIGDKLSRAGAMWGLGTVALEEGNSALAVSSVTKALEAFEAMKMWEYVCRSAAELVRAHLALGDVVGARAVVERVGGLSASAPLHAGLCHLMKGATLRAAGDLAGADAELTASRKAFGPEMSDQDRALLEYECGLLLRDRGQAEEAAVALRVSAAAARRWGRPGLASLAEKVLVS